MITLKIKCEKHPDYKAVQRPRAACAACMHIYKLAGTVKLLPVHGDLFCNPQWDGSELHFEHEEAKVEEPKPKKRVGPKPRQPECPDCSHPWTSHDNFGCYDWDEVNDRDCPCTTKRPAKRGRK